VADELRFPHPADAVSPAATLVTDRNVGHGHVFPRPDGRRAKCGGPPLCRECTRDQSLAAAVEEVRRDGVARLRALAERLSRPEPLRRKEIREVLAAALRDLDPGGPPRPVPQRMDPRVHSRACGLHEHAHGHACAPDCPTCHGRPL
jgi:hypothetical protein